MPRILLAEPLDADAEARLEAAGEVIRPADADPDTMARLVVDCDALVARTQTPVTRELLRVGRRLRVVGVAGVGVDR
ncbi:MAG: phosphoglycerate dehydrogenase, partial [Phycisphaerae bacterium]